MSPKPNVMRHSDLVVIWCPLAPDDGLRIDLSGPVGATRFICPDYEHELVCHAPGLVTGLCQSVFHIERRGWRDNRARHLVRRAAP